MGSLIKALIGKEDLSVQTNTDPTETFSRITSTGSTISLEKIPDIWDGSGRIYVAQVDTPYDVDSYGAVGDGVTDDSSAIQTAIDAAIAAQRELRFSPKTYMVKAALTVTNSGTKSFTMSGSGQGVTRIVTPATGSSGALASGNLITWTCTGTPTSIKDMMIYADTGGNTNIDLLEITSSDGVTVQNLWLSSAYSGIRVISSSNIRISDVQSELNIVNYYFDKSEMLTMTNYHSYQSSLIGVYVINNTTNMTNLVSAGIQLTAGSLVEDGYGGGGTGAAIYIDSLIPVQINGVDISSTGGVGTLWPFKGIYIVTGNVFVTNPTINWCKTHGIHIANGNLTVIGGNIRKIGYYDQSSPWATYGILAGANTNNLIVQGTTIQSEGFGIETQAVNSELIGVITKDCSNGGETGSVNATSGDVAIYFNPQAPERHFKMVGCYLYNVSGTGKTGLKIGNTATPSAGFVKLIGNDIYTSSFDTPFSSAIPNVNLVTYNYHGNNSLLKTEASGSSSIASGATSAIITHGLGLTPLAEHITVIGKENPSNSVGTIWVDTITATQFTVNVENDPGASNWDFGWQVNIR